MHLKWMIIAYSIKLTSVVCLLLIYVAFNIFNPWILFLRNKNFLTLILLYSIFLVNFCAYFYVAAEIVSVFLSCGVLHFHIWSFVILILKLLLSLIIPQFDIVWEPPDPDVRQGGQHQAHRHEVAQGGPHRVRVIQQAVRHFATVAPPHYTGSI